VDGEQIVDAIYQLLPCRRIGLDFTRAPERAGLHGCNFGGCVFRVDGSIRNFVYVSFRVIWQLSDNLVRSSPSP
jgi:hypothetical protein